MKKIEALVYGFVVLTSLVVFGFTFTSKVNAAVVCDPGDRYCSGSYRYYCNSSHRYSKAYCTYGCSGGYCQPAPPTCTWTCNDWTACNSSGIQYCNSQSAYPSGCVGGTSITSRSCTPPCTYSTGTWSECSADGWRTRSVTASPAGCVGGTRPESKEECTPTCTYTYSDWGECTSGGTRTRSILSKSPAGCSGSADIFETCTYIPCSASACYKCYDTTSCTNVGCNWGYNGSSSMNCYSDAAAIPTSTPTGGCDRTQDGVTTKIPLGTVKCGTGDILSGFWTNQLYTCTSSGWTALGDPCSLAGLGCRNPDTYVNSGCSDDSLCTSQGGSCQFMVGGAGTDCTIISTGQPGIIKSNLCLSDKYFTYGSCCVPVSSACGGKWPGSTCVAEASCLSELQYGTVVSCSSGMVCCGSINSIKCYTTDDCGSCEECINPGTVTSKCQSTRTSGGSGSVGGANGGKYDTMPSSGLCSSSYGTTVTDSTGDGGTFNWTCEGQVSGSCRSAGNDAYGSATKCTNQPVVNGACNSNITGTADGDLCYRGTPVYSSSDANHNYVNDSDESEYVWGCQGSRNTCAEGDGTDQLNCSSTINQKPWFKVNDGSILAKGKVTNYVPKTTCDTNGSNCGSTVSNGGIYSKSTSSVSGFDQASKNNESDFSFKIYTYAQLKSQYFDSKGVGTTFAANPDWSDVKTVMGVIFVDGDLKINSDLDTSNFVMIIAKGTITIDPNVNLVNAILVGNKIAAVATETGSTTAVSQLVINGMIHGASEVKFTRSLYPESLNNTTPSVVVNYKPELLFMIPQALARAFSQWKIN